MIHEHTQPVRLNDDERKKVLQAVEEASSEEGFAWRTIALFGSRTNSKARGGDIDLYIKIEPKQGLDLFGAKRKLRIALQNLLGDQKFDIVMDDSVTDLGAFGQMVRNEKVDLWTKS